MYTEYDAIYKRLRIYAEEAHCAVAKGFQYERIVRLRDNVTWSEIINDEEVMFEVIVYDRNSDGVHFAVCAVLASVDGIPTGINGPSFTFDEILNR